MKVLIAAICSCLFVSSFISCKSESAGSATVCDTICVKDSMKFSDDKHALRPYVWISAGNCMADTVTWSYTDMGTNRKMSLRDLTGRSVRLNPSAVACFIKDTSYAWLSFNDCSTGRGYLVKIPYSSYVKGNTLSSAMNAFDPKFEVSPGLAVYSDRGNLFTEDMATGKKATMTFGERLEIDYDQIHEHIDSVNVSATRMWARVKVGKEWKVFEKDFQLK